MNARKATAAVLIMLCLLAGALLAGCTVSNGVFTGMSHSSTDTTLSASYISFDGAYARLVPLKAGDEITFSLTGGEELNAAVERDGEELFSISGGNTFTAPEDGTYTFVMEGEGSNGSFSLSWVIE